MDQRHRYREAAELDELVQAFSTCSRTASAIGSSSWALSRSPTFRSQQRSARIQPPHPFILTRCVVRREAGLILVKTGGAVLPYQIEMENVLHAAEIAIRLSVVMFMVCKAKVSQDRPHLTARHGAGPQELQQGRSRRGATTGCRSAPPASPRPAPSAPGRRRRRPRRFWASCQLSRRETPALNSFTT